MKTDIVIIGGGIIGLSIANQLAEAGKKVTIIEKGNPGEEASAAAAGMLAPMAETAHSIPAVLAKLFEESHALYPDFVKDLQEETGIQIGYQTSGSIIVASDYQEASLLAGMLERCLKNGKKVEEFPPDLLKTKQPGLSGSIEAALYFPQDHYVNNRALIKALLRRAAQLEVEILTGTQVTSFKIRDAKIESVLLPLGEISGEIYINCAGAWAATIGGLYNMPPVRPIRGQLLQLRARPQKLTHLIHSSECYIVPWPDGRILIGSTLENVGFNKTVTADGIHRLLVAALKIAPCLKSAVFEKAWAGLRPDTSDNLPILGKTEISNLIMATGHFRNGILLAPITAKLISELILDGEPSSLLSPFNISRFQEN